jgi:hypothetical protein
MATRTARLRDGTRNVLIAGEAALSEHTGQAASSPAAPTESRDGGSRNARICPQRQLLRVLDYTCQPLIRDAGAADPGARPGTVGFCRYGDSRRRLVTRSGRARVEPMRSTSYRPLRFDTGSNRATESPVSLLSRFRPTLNRLGRHETHRL